MMSLSRVTSASRRLPALVSSQSRVMYSSEPKDGDIGGSGGGAGAIREAGGAFGKREAALEEQYFRKLQSEQLKNLKKHVDDEIKHHEAEMKYHMEAVERLKKKSKDLHKS